MSQRYLLECECGFQLEVEPRNAGEIRSCGGCDRTLEIPPLREIRNLPLAQTTEAAKPRKSQGWTLGKGITFALSVPIMLICLCVFFYSRRLEQIYRADQPSIDDVIRKSNDKFLSADIANMTLTETYDEIWKPIRAESLLIRRTPQHILVNEFRQRMQNWMLGATVIGALALLAIFATLILPSDKP
ncbi:MAG: hypothetical protein AAF497_24625 [Planctomycetota bacterium]